MKKVKTKFLLIFILFCVSLNLIYSATITPCQSNGFTTAINKQYQMTYPNENFLQIFNTESLKDISQIKGLTCIQYVDLTDRNTTGDIANLKNLNNLVYISFYSNPEIYGDICSLASITNLRAIKFAFDPKITGDISCLKSLTKLDTFAMTHTQISGDISVFANMPNLKAIYISGTNIYGDICSLKKLTELQELGIADEYPGNPDIYGDLSCLNNLTKLTRVSLYNTNATNCEEFTKTHPNIEQGGCSKESMKTLVDYAQKYEEKIGKVNQNEIRGQSNYNNDDNQNKPNEFGNEMEYKKSDNRNFLIKFVYWIKGLFGKPKDEQMNRINRPGNCKSQAECDAFCQNPENNDICSKFDEQSNNININQPSPEQTYQLVCRVSILPSSKGTTPYSAKVCVNNPTERVQQSYKDYIDFEGDGTWDNSDNNNNGCHSYIYSKSGTFSVKAKIANSTGAESNICETTLTIS
ncbi:MAG TPA: hypothetical protein P5277_04625 [Candidatus Paceibacterota bacterium]|nr:hypothetical protein [Candidatus Paceibacterota bacterium]